MQFKKGELDEQRVVRISYIPLNNDCVDANIDGYINGVSGKRWNKLDILIIFIYLCC